MYKFIPVLGLSLLHWTAVLSQTHTVEKVKITILSTMLAQEGVGEWGFSALIEADSTRILFDAGGRKRTVLENAKELNIDLSKVPVLVLSHWHDDHTAGWISLRKELKPVHPAALSTTHVAAGFFDIRVSAATKDSISRRKDSLDYVATEGRIRTHSSFAEILPGVYLTGNVPRIHDEKNYYKKMLRLDSMNKLQEDDIPDDMSLVIATKQGLLVISGCGHSGIINTLDHIQKNLPNQKIIAAIGGFHLLKCTDEQLNWTALHLQKAGIRYFMGAHCTGIDAVYQIRNLAHLKRGECLVGSVGDVFNLDTGFSTGDLNR